MRHVRPIAPRREAPRSRDGARLRRSVLLPAALLGGLLATASRPVAVAAEEPAPSAVAWVRRVAEAYDAAKAADKPLMIAINSERVDGGRVEPAAKELREVTYRDARVIESSRRFVCAYLTAEGSSDDFGELRARYQVDGLIVSPQHIFAYPDGTLISRHEYWPYGYGEDAVKALLDLMEKAWTKDQARRGLPPGTPAPTPGAPDAPKPPGAGLFEAPPPPADEAGRATWIQDMVNLVYGQDADRRREALARLLGADKDGAGLAAVVARLEEFKKDPEALVDVARAFGRPGLAAAVPTLVDLLAHKEDPVRANAAVSLEYVGSKDAVDALGKAAAREKDEAIANHMYRALGRSAAAAGEEGAKSRDLLAKRAGSGKSEAATYGPIIGLAYFEKDPKAAREVEKLIEKEGVVGGGGRRGGGRGVLRGTLLIWCLSEIRDPKSAKFVREELLGKVNSNDPWAGARATYYEAARKHIAGDDAARAEVNGGVERVLGFSGGVTGLSDDARKGREEAGFTPKGEWAVTPRRGGPPGGPGGGPPGGGN